MRGQRLVGIVSRRDLVRVIARRDEDIESEVSRKLSELGIASSPGAMSVLDGVATLDAAALDRRLAESVALTVPGVLEVRFMTHPSRGPKPGVLPAAPDKDV